MPTTNPKEDNYQIFRIKEFFVSELNRFVRVKISTKALKTINSKGLMTYLAEQGLSLADVEI